MQLKEALIVFRCFFNKNKIIIKSSFFKWLNKTSSFSEHSVLFRRCYIRNSKIGRYTYFAGNADVNNVEMGAFCSIADGVKIGVGSHPIHYISTHPVFYSDKTIFPYRLLKHQTLSCLNDHSETKTINIGHDVWIGTNAIILDGVSIGNGAVIGAGAVVTKDVDDYAIVGGVPATLIKYRIAPNKIDGVNWWELDVAQLVSILEVGYESKKSTFDL